MEFTPSAEHETSPAAEQIAAICRRAFGDQVTIQAVAELGGGTFNRVYRITRAGEPDTILRIAPRDDENTAWSNAALMRREHSIQPFFAPLAQLMPRSILVDFTRELIDQDYLVQTFLEGERWDQVEEQLSPEDDEALWGQFGRILKTIHGVQGSRFGYPYPGKQFASWSETLVDRFLRVSDDMVAAGLDQSDLMRVFAAIQRAPDLLDEVATPALLHGDLWLFNMLIRRDGAGPTISAVLDADRAWWGDPLVDRTIFVLTKHDSPRMQRCREHFWQAYGQLPETPGRHFREQVYEAFHASSAWVCAAGQQDEETVARASAHLREAADRIDAWLGARSERP